MLNAGYQCHECGGVGYYRIDVSPDDWRFGRLFPCPSCNHEQIAKQAGLLSSERSISLDNMITRDRPSTVKMIEAAKKFIGGGFGGWLSLCGESGVGKSHVLKAIVNAALDKGIEARYITMADILAMAREAFESQRAGDTDYGRITRIAQIRLLAIDEIDPQKIRITDYSREIQTYLMDLRYRNKDNLGTVLAWNGGIAVIREVMPWLASRITEFMLIENTDRDFRPVLAKINGKS